MNMKNKGFIAVTAVVILASITLLFANITMQIAVDYSDSVMRHEWRIQANLNAQSCLSAVQLMVSKDYFLNGELKIKEFGCTATVAHDYLEESISIKAQSVFNGVNSDLLTS